MHGAATSFKESVRVVNDLAASAPAGTAVAAGMHGRSVDGVRRWCWYAAAPLDSGWAFPGMPITFLSGRRWTHRGAARAQHDAQAMLTGSTDPGVTRLHRAATVADVLAVLAVLAVLVVTLRGDRAVLAPALAAFAGALTARAIRTCAARRSARH